MATWMQLRNYVHANYRISDDIGNGLKLEFRTTNGRTQLVFLSQHLLLDSTEEWVLIESPFGLIGEIDLARAATAVGTMVCGGIGVAFDKFVTLRHAVRLADLDVDEFERPLVLVTASADRLEAMFSTADRF
jgi:hypothetical protein